MLGLGLDGLGLRVALRGSGRSVDLRCARRRRVRAGEGQTDVADGGSELWMIELEHHAALCA
jgi:hypothetical protein